MSLLSFTGFLDWSIWTLLAYLLVTTHLTMVTVTLFLHRHQAHRAVDLHPLVTHPFRFWLWLSTGMSTREWVAVHRKHHAKVETVDDPHSPQIHGLRKLLLQGSELYREAAADKEILQRYGFGTPQDWLETRLYGAHPTLGLGLYFVVDVLLFGPIGITVWALQMMAIPFFAAGIINGLGHFWGYRNYEVADASRNIFPWGILIGGEELHNNHHAHGSSARFSEKWWEFDVGWFYLRVLSVLGLAQVKKLPPKTVQVPGKVLLDTEAMRAIIATRFQVMARYSREVLKSVHRQEMKRSADSAYRRILARARRLLRREESMMDDRARHRLAVALSSSPDLKTVYEFKQRLQTLWTQTAATQEHLLKAVQDWCRQAEATGIKALEDFARSLRSYSLQEQGLVGARA